MSGCEHSDELFDFLYKTSNNTLLRTSENVTKIFGSFVNQKSQRQISLSNFQNDALKNLCIRYNTALPASSADQTSVSCQERQIKTQKSLIGGSEASSRFR